MMLVTVGGDDNVIADGYSGGADLMMIMKMLVLIGMMLTVLLNVLALEIDHGDVYGDDVVDGAGVDQDIGDSDSGDISDGVGDDAQQWCSYLLY